MKNTLLFIIMLEKFYNFNEGLLGYFALGSLALCIVAIGWIVHTSIKIKSSVIVTGKVVEIVETKNYRNDSPTFAPRISYLNLNSVMQSMVSTTWSSHSSYKVNDKIKLAITKDYPPIILTTGEAFGVQIIFTSLLASVFVASFLCYFCVRFVKSVG